VLGIHWLGTVTLRVAQAPLGSSDFRLLLAVVLVPAALTVVVLITSEAFKRLFPPTTASTRQQVD
jgi:hypothetical protein